MGEVCPRSAFICSPSENKETDEIYKTKAKLLLAKVSDTYEETLPQYGYGMPYADETILKDILKMMLKLGLTNRKSIEKVLQFLPQNPEYFGG